MTTNSYTPGPWTARQLFHAYEPSRSLGWIVETENRSRIGWADYGDADTNKGEESPHPISGANARAILARVRGESEGGEG